MSILPLLFVQSLSSMFNDITSMNLKKTIGITGFAAILLATAFAFSSWNVLQQPAMAQQQNQNATTIANTTAVDTFTAKGIITGTIQAGQTETSSVGNTSPGANQTLMPSSNTTANNATQTASSSSSSSKPFLVGGDWQMQANNGNITNFRANFTMVRTDGSEHHSHDVMNFKVGNNTNFQLDPKGKSTFNGTADYAVNGTTKWPGVNTAITIEKATILTIQPNEQEVKQHFQGQPIYGIALTVAGENGTNIATSAPAGGNQTQQGGPGGILGGITKPLQDLFGGGKK
jgi:hypothetical protein